MENKQVNFCEQERWPEIEWEDVLDADRGFGVRCFLGPICLVTLWASKDRGRYTKGDSLELVFSGLAGAVPFSAGFLDWLAAEASKRIAAARKPKGGLELPSTFSGGHARSMMVTHGNEYSVAWIVPEGDPQIWAERLAYLADDGWSFVGGSGGCWYFRRPRMS